MFLTLSDDVKQTILMHADSPASTLFKALKGQYECTGVSAEFYTKQDFKNAKLSKYNTIGDFITGLTNLAHIYNKEVKNGASRCIEDCDIAMCILHQLPSCMRMIQTLLIRTAPPADQSNWDLPELKQIICDEE